MQQIEFPRPRQHVLAWWDDTGLWIRAGWTVGMSLSCAAAYLASYNASPASGFFEHDGRVILSHRDAKIELSREEAKAILGLIRAAIDHSSS